MKLVNSSLYNNDKTVNVWSYKLYTMK